MYYIYRTTNLINGKTYIGQHKFDLNKDDNYMGSGKLLRQAIKKYGIENFSKEIIEIVTSKFEVNILEKYYIAKERASNKNGCYNIANGGTGGDLGEEVNKRKRGQKRHESVGRKISEANKGKTPWNKGTKGVCRAWNKGKHIKCRLTEYRHTEEMKKILSEKSKKLADERRDEVKHIQEAYWAHKANGGVLKWNEFQKEYSKGSLTN